MGYKDKEKYNEYMRSYVLKRYHKRRLEAIDFLGGKCVNCESIDNLEFDHIDPKEKDFTIGRMSSIAKEKFWEEIAKCVLRCKDCHTVRSTEQLKERKPWRHGTYWSVQKHKCKCEECLSFKRIMNDIRNKQRRKARLASVA